MSDKIEAAWKEYLNSIGVGHNIPVGEQFTAGYLSGQQSAWQLPEVRAEDLLPDQYYLAFWKEANRLVPVQTNLTSPVTFISMGDLEIPYSDVSKFFGPLPMPGEGEGMEEIQCKNCRFMVMISRGFGECRRFPPIVKPHTGCTAFPKMADHEWCGEFKPHQVPTTSGEEE